jgi:transcriptional/translational regulatory protein YebC/TACO1
MFARWDKMAKAFTRVAKDITIAVKAGGPDPDSNPALRRAIQNGRAVNMPKDKVTSAIKRAHDKDTADYEEVIYEKTKGSVEDKLEVFGWLIEADC